MHPDDSSRAHRLRYLIAIGAWTAIGLLFALPGLSVNGGWRPVLGSLAQWWSWGLLTPLIVGVDRRLPFSSKQHPRRVLAHLILSLFFTATFIYLVAAIHALMGIGAWGVLLNARLLRSSFAMFLWNWLVYLLIVGGWQAFQYNARYLSGELRVERLERQFAEARLNALRMQLEPHFLFNALNTISSQVERDPKLARRMIEHLGDLLRTSLDSKDKKEVPLAEELASLHHYLAIQKIRFGDQVKVEMRVDQEVKFALVPGLLLQPLVENAIRHGISGRSSGGTVTICVARVDNRLEIRVLDDGGGLPTAWNLETSPGVGLAVTRQRIAELHPNGASRFAIRNRTSGGTEVEIAFPLNLGGEMTPPPPGRIRVLVVDDETPARQRLIDLLHNDPQIGEILEAANGMATPDMLRRERPDLVFLDVQMAELDGLGVIEAVGAEQMPLTVFVTAYDQHAIRAFDLNALDYLLKPFSDERFEATMFG